MLPLQKVFQKSGNNWCGNEDGSVRSGSGKQAVNGGRILLHNPILLSNSENLILDPDEILY